jgi:hypothetical protein
LKLVALSVGPPFGEQSAFMDDLDVQIDDPAESFRNKVGDAVDHATAAAPSDQDHVGDVLKNGNCTMSCTCVERWPAPWFAGAPAPPGRSA